MEKPQQRRTRRSPETEAKWREVIRNWRASGQTLPVFAEERGLSHWTVRWWCTELKKRDSEGTHDGVKAPLSVPSPAGLSVVPVRVVKVRPMPGGGTRVLRAARSPVYRSDPETATGPGGGVIEIVPFGQVRIRVREDFDARTLRAVLDVLEAPC